MSGSRTFWFASATNNVKARANTFSTRLDSYPSADSLSLSNGGRSRYREFEITTRYTFRGTMS